MGVVLWVLSCWCCDCSPPECKTAIGFCCLELFHLQQEDEKRSWKINLYLWTGFLLLSLDLLLTLQAAEILSLSLQVLRRSKCNVFCHLSLCLIPHFLKSPGIFSAPYPHLSLPAPLPCLFIAPRCTCLVCFAHCCVRCVHRPLRHVNCLVSWFSLTLPFKKRPKISATNPKNWKNKPPQTRQAGKYTVDLSVLS